MTYRQKLAASKLVENGGNLGKAMLEAGYSKAMAKNPYKLTRSKGWSELTHNLYSDEDLIEKHQELLNSVKILKLSFPQNLSNEEIRFIIESNSQNKVVYIRNEGKIKSCFYITPNTITQAFALNLAYKIKGYLDKSNSKQNEEESYSLKHEVERIRKLFNKN